MTPLEVNLIPNILETKPNGILKWFNDSAIKQIPSATHCKRRKKKLFQRRVLSMATLKSC